MPNTNHTIKQGSAQFVVKDQVSVLGLAGHITVAIFFLCLLVFTNLKNTKTFLAGGHLQKISEGTR